MSDIQIEGHGNARQDLVTIRLTAGVRNEICLVLMHDRRIDPQLLVDFVAAVPEAITRVASAMADNLKAKESNGEVAGP